MRTFFPGNDRGNALLLSISLIIIISLAIISFIPRVINFKRMARNYKEQILTEINQTNRDIINNYDLY
jgi:Tfp pilus assembly protein PilX